MILGLVQDLSGTPGTNICSMCGEHNPPYVTGPLTLKLATAEGVERRPGHVAICVGDADHPGCVARLIRAAEGFDPWERQAVEASHQRALVELHGKIEELELALIDAQAKQVVPLDDVLKMLPAVR